MNKISPEAEKVRNALLDKGIETPMITPQWTAMPYALKISKQISPLK